MFSRAESVCNRVVSISSNTVFDSKLIRVVSVARMDTKGFSLIAFVTYESVIMCCALFLRGLPFHLIMFTSVY